MDIDPTRSVPNLEPGQKVLIKTGNFAGLQGIVTGFQKRENEPEPTLEVRINVRVRGRNAPVLFENPTESDLERIDDLAKDPPSGRPPGLSTCD